MIHYLFFLFCLMLDAIVQTSLFSGYKVGLSNVVCISHLYFANDILEESWANIRILKTNLIFLK